MKKVLKCFLTPVIIAVLGSILLLAASLVPTRFIQKHAEVSAQQLMSMPQWPNVINVDDIEYKMDNYTDSQIMMQSYELRCTEPSTIYSNPKHVAVDAYGANMPKSFAEVVNGAECEMNYISYWMGFRAYIRPLLMFGSYFDIRRLMALIYFALIITTTLAVYKRRGGRVAACFAASVLILNPAIVSHSLQYSVCFIMAFIFTLYLLAKEKSGKAVYYPFAFGVFGALTQFFDFYTTPIITYGIPMLVLLASPAFEKKRLSLTLKSLLSWFWGYVGMWLIKMPLGTMTTSENGFAYAFKSAFFRLGIGEYTNPAANYSPVDALKNVWGTAVHASAASFFIVFGILFCAIVFLLIRQGKKAVFTYAPCLFVAAIPFLWFVVAAQPTIIHTWFQHRSICVFFFGALLTVSSAVSNINFARIFRRKKAADIQQKNV